MSSFSRTIPAHTKAAQGRGKAPGFSSSSPARPSPSSPPSKKPLTPRYDSTHQPRRHPHSHTVDLSSSSADRPPPSPRSPSSASSHTQPLYSPPPSLDRYPPPHARAPYPAETSPRSPYSSPPPHSQAPPFPHYPHPRPHSPYPASSYSASYAPSPYQPYPTYGLQPAVGYPPSNSLFIPAPHHSYGFRPAPQSRPVAPHDAFRPTIIPLSLCDDPSPSSLPLSTPAEEKEAESSSALEKEQREEKASALRAACQRFILAILTGDATAASVPPWRTHPEQSHPLVAEYESLYQQMTALSPSLHFSAVPSPAGPSSAVQRPSSPSVVSQPPPTARLSAERRSPAPSREKRGSTFSLLAAAVERKWDERRRRKESGATAPAEKAELPSQSSSPRHSFSVLMPAFSTLHAVARQVMMAKKKEKEKKDLVAGAVAEQKEEDEDDEEDDDESHPSSSTLPLQHTPSPQTRSPLPPTATPPPAKPPVAFAHTAPLPPHAASNQGRTFKSRYAKHKELHTLPAPSALTTPSIPSPASSVLSSTIPIPALPALPRAASSSLAPPHHARSASAAGSALAAPPARSKAHLRSLSNLPPLPPLPSLTRPLSSPLPGSARASLSPTPAARIIHYPYRAPRDKRPAKEHKDRAWYDEKWAADELGREGRDREEKRRRWTQWAAEREPKKWGRRGWPHKTRLRVEDNCLVWNYKSGMEGGATEEERAERRVKGGKLMALRGIKALVPGLDRRARPKVAFSTSVLCFSLVGKERVLELECGDVRERDEWIEGLAAEVAEAKTAGCRWSGRLLNSIAPDATVQLTIAPGDEGISFV